MGDRDRAGRDNLKGHLSKLQNLVENYILTPEHDRILFFQSIKKDTFYKGNLLLQGFHTSGIQASPFLPGGDKISVWSLTAR